AADSMSSNDRPNRRRGRPHKFGRPARLIALTLPEDVIDWLRHVDPDPARAIVELHARSDARAAAPHGPDVDAA
ncbi:MAG: hypothetical protein ACLGHP_07950, partial [Vicinamibacteria bacterium]